jgi:hypothetical protein
MLVLAGLTIVSAVVTSVFVASGRRPSAPVPAAPPRVHGCAVPTS